VYPGETDTVGPDSSYGGGLVVTVRFPGPPIFARRGPVAKPGVPAYRSVALMMIRRVSSDAGW
jgi:hypothetical protein